ncbi:Rtf2 RING-finger-domain-containing protein [Tribonema minus]|uniref:Rtf2 RING-finger-domain-containing protein n=1 Tax=Tribonema minus TaxID=303371 RepID=A0A836CNB3_9STRA|nr:Rtf2 RING-finger-domain-containing protein [Tribonema minus]
MGGDGGVIAANRKFLRQCGDGFLNNTQTEAVDEREQKQLRTKVCAVSNERLQEPIVVCELGYLYNKDAVLSALLDRTLDPTFAHLRGLKDLIEPKLTANRAYDESDSESPPYMCPITFQEFTGRYPFSIIRSTGWVISDRAIAEVGIEGLQAEYGPFVQDDVMRLAPDKDEQQQLRQRMETRREQLKAAKAKLKGEKAKLKGEKRALAAGEGAEAAVDAAAAEGHEGSKKKHKKAAKAAAQQAAGATARPAVASRSVTEAEAAVRAQKASSAVYGSLFGKHKPTATELFASGKAACPI